MVDQKKFTTYLNGRFIPHDQAVAAMQGYQTQAAGGHYDGERTFNRQVFKLRQHLERLFRGLDYSNIDSGLNLEEMEAVTLEVMGANQHLLGPDDEFSVTQVVNSTPGSLPDEPPKVNVVVFCQPLQFSAFARSYQTGVRIVTPATYSVPDRTAQTGIDDKGQRVYLLMMGKEGSITECVGANFMFVRDGRIKLPVATVNGLRLGEGLPGPVTGRLLDAWREMAGTDFVQQALDHLSSGES